MKTYGKISAEGAVLIVVPVLAVFYVALLGAALPLFALGLLKRGAIWIWQND